MFGDWRLFDVCGTWLALAIPSTGEKTRTLFRAAQDAGNGRRAVGMESGKGKLLTQAGEKHSRMRPRRGARPKKRRRQSRAASNDDMSHLAFSVSMRKCGV